MGNGTNNPLENLAPLPARTIVHVCERFGGGLADAIGSYAAARDGFRHVLLYGRSNEVPLPPMAGDLFSATYELPDGHLARVRAVRKLVRELGAAAVHSHSAFAGVYARLAMSRRRIAQIHSPHCFPFEREDRTDFMRSAFHLVERVLANNTTLFITCSLNELERARELRGGPATFVVNVAHDIPEQLLPQDAEKPASDLHGTVVGVGRIAPQKGPDHFAEVARRFAAQGRPERFTWIGRGNASDMAEDLVDAGVQVTGWLPKEDGLAALAEGSVLLHTARWEGFPVSLLEAVAVGVPILVLERPYARHLPPELVAREDEMGERVAQILDDPRVREANLAACRRALADHTPARQREQLVEAYRSVTGGSGSATVPRQPEDELQSGRRRS